MEFQLMMDCVAKFHESLGLSRTQPIAGMQPREDLERMGKELVRISGVLERQMVEENNEDKRVLRAHLMVEELGELLVAMASGDEVDTLDGLADLLYVLIGSAVTMDLPLGLAFAEVHTSNMTKRQQKTDASKDRVRDKGPQYVAPKIKELLESYRSGRLKVTLMRGADELHAAIARQKIDAEGLTPDQLNEVKYFIKGLKK